VVVDELRLQSGGDVLDVVVVLAIVVVLEIQPLRIAVLDLLLVAAGQVVVDLLYVHFKLLYVNEWRQRIDVQTTVLNVSSWTITKKCCA